MSFVQMTQRTYRVDKLPRGQRPVFEFDLLDHEQLVGIAHAFQHDYRSRKTVDHVVIAWVAIHLGDPTPASSTERGRDD